MQLKKIKLLKKIILFDNLIKNNPNSRGTF